MKEIDKLEYRKLCDGDRSALGSIYHRHKDAMYTYAIYMTADRTTSEDVIHDTFLKLAEQAKNGNRIDSLRNWLFVSLRNRLFNIIKKENTRASLLDTISTDRTANTLDNETKSFIREVLSQLTPDERDLILMREQQGYTIAELATLNNCSEEAIRVRLFRVRKKMQTIAKG